MQRKNCNVYTGEIDVNIVEKNFKLKVGLNRDKMSFNRGTESMSRNDNNFDSAARELWGQNNEDL